MDGCLGIWDASQWINIHQQGLNPTPGSISILDPIQELQRDEGTNDYSMAGMGTGIRWDEGAPGPYHLPVIATSGSIDQSLDHLLSGSNSNTDTTNSVEDDGISMMYFSTTNNNNNNNNPRKRNQFGFLLSSSKEEPKCGFRLIREMSPSPGPKENKRAKLGGPSFPTSKNISFQHGPSSSSSSMDEPDAEAMHQMKEMIYRAAAFRPVSFGVEEVVEKPKRRNVRISSDPQTVAARQRRERISEKLRVLQKLVPGGNKMDTASMLDEAANYLKFLRNQVKALEALGNNKKLDDNHDHNLHYNYSLNYNASTNLQFSSYLPPLIPMQQVAPFSLLQNPNQVPKS